ncbi:hypothetical protein Tco_1559031, partial [Tanacetum coccineum]
KRKTTSRRVVKKKFTLSAKDNIITDDPDVALELGKSIILTEAEEAKVARKFGSRSFRGVAIQDTPSVPNPKLATSKSKLKGAQSLTRIEKEVANIMQSLKESKKTSKRQPSTGGSSKGTGAIPGVPDESTVVSATSSERTGTKPGVPNEEKDITEENKDEKDDDVDDEGDDDISDTKDTDNEDDETESDEDDIYKFKIRVRKYEDEEMLNAKAKDSEKGDTEVSDAAKADAEKTSEVKNNTKKTELPPKSSSLFVSLGFGDQFLKVSYDSSLVGTVKNTTDAEINSLLEVKIQSKVPHIQSPSMLRVLLRVTKLEKDASELKNIDLSDEDLSSLKTQVSSVVDNYLGSKIRDVFQREL